MNSKNTTPEQLDELAAWLRPVSPLTSYAKTLKCNLDSETTTEDSTTSGKVDEPSILKGIDMDTLPPEVRDALVARDTEYKLNLTQLNKIQTQNEHTVAELNRNKSRADKAEYKLKQHNLQGEDHRASEPNVATEVLSAFEAAYIEEGHSAAQAKVLAKTMARALPIYERVIGNSVAQTVAPMAQAVGNMQANDALQRAVLEDSDGLLAGNPELYEAVKQGASFLSNSGQAVNADTIANLIDLNYGKLHRAGKIMKQEQIITRNQGVGNLSTRMRGGDMPTPRGYQPSNGEPMAVNAETGAAVAATVAAMTRGLKLKGVK
jgi:hypothetical protein